MDIIMLSATLAEPLNILTVGLITISAGLLGLLSKYKIFLLLSIGGYVTLIVQFQDYPALVIALIGVIIFNMWYATVGGVTK